MINNINILKLVFILHYFGIRSYAHPTVSKSCQDLDFPCKNGKCVQQDYWCDSDDDCGDNTDEMYCTDSDFETVVCPPDFFRCTDGSMCIPITGRCDGHNSCHDKSDEFNCKRSSKKCEYDQLSCNNGNCVNEVYWCDYRDDCGDSTDEDFCELDSANETHTCPPNFFRCFDDSMCIPGSGRCNGYASCHDDSDEMNCSPVKVLPLRARSDTTRDIFFPQLASDFETSTVANVENILHNFDLTRGPYTFPSTSDYITPDFTTTPDFKDNDASATLKYETPEKTPDFEKEFTSSHKTEGSEETLHFETEENSTTQSNSDSTSQTHYDSNTKSNYDLTTFHLKTEDYPTTQPNYESTTFHFETKEDYPTTQPYYDSPTQSNYESTAFHFETKEDYPTTHPNYESSTFHFETKEDYPTTQPNYESSTFHFETEDYPTTQPNYESSTFHFETKDYPTTHPNYDSPTKPNYSDPTLLKSYTAFSDQIIKSAASRSASTKHFAELRPENFTHQREMAANYLVSQRTDDFGWGDETPRALMALIWSNVSSMPGTYMLMVQRLNAKLSLDIARNESRPMKLTELALYINVIISTCQNPRNFNGIDLVKILRDRVNVEHQTSKLFVSPSIYLTLCIKNVTTRNDVEKLRSLVLSTERSTDKIGIQALALLAITCISKFSKFPVDGLQSIAVQMLLNKIQSEGLPRNVYEVSLLLQALNEARVNQSAWPRADAVAYLLKRQTSSGSFGDILATYSAMPILSGRSTLRLSEHCVPSTEYQVPIKDLEKNKHPKISVKYSLDYGYPVEFSLTMSLHVPRGTKFLDIMNIAQERSPNYSFQMDDRERNPHVYSIGGIPNDAEKGMFWNLGVQSNYSRFNAGTKGVTPYHGNIKTFIPKNGDKIVFWMKPI